MKILCLADLHLTEKKPQCRHDEENWMETINRKLKWIGMLAMKKRVFAITIAGDIFDSTNRCSHEFMSAVLREFRWLNDCIEGTHRRLLTIPGNHDLVNNDRSRILQSPYGVLQSADMTYPPQVYPYMDEMAYGDTKYEGIKPIVIGHYGLWHKEKPFKDAPDEGNVEWFVKNRLPKTCKLFITGHYHIPFVAKVNDTTVVNCGCPFRMRADLIDYKPTVTIADVDSDFNVTTETFEIPLQYGIRRDYIDDKKDRETALDEMVGNIEGDFEAGFNFKDNFYNLSKECENSTEINKEFERCANGYYN